MDIRAARLSFSKSPKAWEDACFYLMDAARLDQDSRDRMASAMADVMCLHWSELMARKINTEMEEDNA